MKLKKIIYLIPLAAIMVATGCRKTQFNVNQNINNPTDSTVTYDVVLPAALHATGVTMAQQWGPIQNWMGYWARSGTYAPSITEETYQITTSFGNGIWNACYDNIYDYQIVISKANAAGAGFYEGIARIMKAFNYQILVDVYGNVPYSQAGKGSGNPTPAYDKGVDIYKDLLLELEKASTLIKNANTGPTGTNKNILNDDIVFGVKQYAQASGVSNANYIESMKPRWIRFANTLRLKLLVHAYAVPGFPITAELGKIDANGYGYLAAGENVQVQPGYATDKPNPFYNSYKATTAGAQTANNIYYRANAWGLGYYEANSDTREARFYDVNGDGNYKGVAYGLPPVNANAAANLSGIGAALVKTAASPQVLLTSAESFFLRAEARWRGFITSGPTYVELTNTGINESFLYLGATGTGTAYIAANAGWSDVDVTAVSNTPANAPTLTPPVGGLFTIISQKWFALNGIDPLEVWTDYRRLSYKEVAPASNVTDHFVYGAGVGYDPGPPLSVAPQNTATKIPVRYLYPQTEYNYNAGNVSAEGTITPYTKIFWDTN
jgi:hypothetical protein